MRYTTEIRPFVKYIITGVVDLIERKYSFVLSFAIIYVSTLLFIGIILQPSCIVCGCYLQFLKL